MSVVARWVQVGIFALVASCGSGTSSGIADAGAPTEGGTLAESGAPASGTLVTIPSALASLRAVGFAGDVRGEKNYNYEINVELANKPYTIKSSFYQGGASCSGERTLDPSEMDALDALIPGFVVVARSSKGTEFCLFQGITLVPRDGDEIEMSTLNNGCDNAPNVLCARRDDLYALLARLVAVDNPAACPPDYLGLIHRQPPPESPYPPAECSGVVR